MQQMPMNGSGSTLVKQMRRRSRNLGVLQPAAPAPEEEEEEQQDEMDVGAELEWTLGTLSEAELRQQYRDLYTKLMMSARLGQELLDREDSYKHQLAVMQQKLDRFEEQEIYLRRTAEEQRVQLIAQERELSELSRERFTEQVTQNQLLEEATATESEIHQQRIMLRELQEQVHRLTVENYDLNNQLAETKIEIEAQARLNQELNGRLMKYNAARPKSALSTSSRPTSRPASRIGTRAESNDYPSPSHQFHFGRDSNVDETEEADIAFDPEQVFELEDQIAELTQLLAERDDIINELREDLNYFRSLHQDTQSSSPGHKSWAQEMGESFASGQNHLSPNAVERTNLSRLSSRSFQEQGDDEAEMQDQEHDREYNQEQDQDQEQYIEGEYDQESLLATIRDLEDQLQQLQDAYSTLEYQNSCIKTLLKAKGSKRRQSRAILFPEGYVPDNNPDELIAIPDSGPTPSSDIDYDSNPSTTPAIDSPVYSRKKEAAASRRQHMRTHSTPITVDQMAQDSLNANVDDEDDDHPDDGVAPRSKSMSAVPEASSEIPSIPAPTIVAPVPVRPEAPPSSPQRQQRNTLNLANLHELYHPPSTSSVITVETASQCDVLVTDDKNVQCETGPTQAQVQALKDRIEQLEQELKEQRAGNNQYVPPGGVSRGGYYAADNHVQSKTKSSGWCWPFLCCGKQDDDDDEDALARPSRTENSPLLQHAY